MISICFTKAGQLYDAAHAFVEQEYIYRRILEKGKNIPKADEYILVYDEDTIDISGVLGIIENRRGKLPFQESFSGVECGEHSVEMGRFVIKRMISIEKKMDIGRKLFAAAVNWYILRSKIRRVDMKVYLETHDYVIDFFNKVTNKKNIFFRKEEAVFNNHSLLSKNSMGFIQNSRIYQVNTVNAICPEAQRDLMVA